MRPIEPALKCACVQRSNDERCKVPFLALAPAADLGRLLLDRSSRFRISIAKCRLTGVADIAPTGDALIDNFLQLPTDVLAVMQSQFTFNV